MAIDLTVGIVNYNGSRHLEACIHSVKRLEGVEVRLIVADNASTDGSRDWLTTDARIDELILNSSNLGFGAAHNQIISRIKSDYYLALNPDATLERDYAARIIEALDSSMSYGWATGKIMLMDSGSAPTGQFYSVGHALLRDGYAFNIGYGDKDKGQFDDGREVFGANAAAAIYKLEMLEDLRQSEGEYFDARMFLHYEDVDLDWRARLLGWRCRYVPQAVAHHIGGYAHADKDRRLVTQGLANRYRSVLKNAFLSDLLLYNFPLYMLHSLLRLIWHMKTGVKLLAPLSTLELPQILSQRREMARRRRIRRREMLDWFRWSALQPGFRYARLQSRALRLLSGCSM